MIRFALLNVAALGLGATVGTSCISVNYPTVAFRCNPRQADNCPDTHFCCSDDPAAEEGALPDFTGKNISGGQAPYFSGQNNALGTSGMCVNRDDIPMGSGLLDPAALNCPIPCNPTWEEDEIGVVCGANRVCCQTVELDPLDCVSDGDEIRPVNGADIGDLTDWNPGAHRTHQDPAGIGCSGFAQGDMTSDIFTDCIRQLTVADQRGFCMALQAGQACPTMQPGYVDACTLMAGGGAPPA